MMKRWLLAPVDHFMAAFGRVIPESPWIGMGAVFAGFVVSWWIYVPIHELLHAFGCMATGGSVERLEIDAQYGAALLQRVFPFVAVGSDYAGQLTGFDTHGNDLIYLATDFAPFLLTIFPGVPLLVWLGRRARAGAGTCFLFGLALPVAMAPFTNLIGDYYEMGSILVSRAVSWTVGGFDLERWRSDDLIKTANELLFQGSFRFADLAGLTVASVLGLLLAFVTYGLGRLVGQQLVAPEPDS